MLLVTGLFPFVVYLVVSPFDVGNVTVTFPFVHVAGLMLAFVLSTSPIVPVVTLIELDTFVLPALSVALVNIVYFVV